ncbi:MAG: dual specificity protein phosphatase family protein [Oligoflexia bacterium]|nr:dual specificity protein phosphatase family protein [Oligoflexia bacterium]
MIHSKWIAFCFIALGLNSTANANNLHLIDSNPTTGFAIYRTSRPSEKDMKEFCKLGIQEMTVLSGTAEKYEFKHQGACPTLKVVYNESQSAKIPMSESFLRDFDNWVKDAQAQGKKIAFRCSCGCHRTGRLAAYYQMKYQGLSVKEATDVMYDLGKWMFLHRQLKPQVQALNDYIHGRPCSVKEKHCVVKK